MKGPRDDFYSDGRLLGWLAAGWLTLGVLVAWGMSAAIPLLLWAAGALLLIACAAGVFFTTSRLLARHHPVLSVFGDRLWYRGLREQVVMLRNVVQARHVRMRRFGVLHPCLELDLRDDDEPVQLLLLAVDCDPDEVVGLIMQRIAALQLDDPSGEA